MLAVKEYQLLNHLKEHPDATKETIVSTFGESAEIRLNNLHMVNAIRLDGHYVKGEFIPSGKYLIANVGKMLLEDYAYEHHLTQKAKWEDRAWKFAPIIISTLALIVAATSLAQALHWIDLAR